MTDAAWRATAQAAIDAKTKPAGSLGEIEDVAVRLTILQRSTAPAVDPARICIFAADHGIAREGVSAYPQSVTTEMMRNFDRGGGAINVLARNAGASLEMIDVGVDGDLASLTAIRHERVAPGTRSFLREAAMTETEVASAVEVGYNAARRAAHDGVRLLAIGEMGIGNTTTAAALLAAFTGAPSNLCVGVGTGVDAAGVRHKEAVVDQALDVHQLRHGTPNAPPPLEMLRRVGGLEIAALAGAALEAAQRRIAVLVDGYIATVAALVAVRIAERESANGDPAPLDSLARALLFSHSGAERGHALAITSCAAAGDFHTRPLLRLSLRLGEGSGAALAIPLVRGAAAVMREMATFAAAGVSEAVRAPAGEHASAGARIPAAPHATVDQHATCEQPTTAGHATSAEGRILADRAADDNT